MTRKTSIIRIPFADGQHEDIDSKMLPDGFLSRVRNMRLRKDGRFGVRFGFSLISNTSFEGDPPVAGTLAVARDIYKMRERLLITAGASAAQVASLYEMTTGPSPVRTWRRADGVIQASGIRDLTVIGYSSQNIRFADCAATGGYVCVVFYNPQLQNTVVQVIRAADNVEVFVNRSVSGQRPRVVATNGKFWIYTLTTSQTEISRFRFDPAVDTSLVSIGASPTSGGGTIIGWDTCVDASGFYLDAVQTAGAPTQVSIRRFNGSTGAITHNFNVAGVAAASATGALGLHCDGANWSICTVATLGSTAAILRTGLLSGGGAVAAGPTTLASGNNVSSQPGLSAGQSATNILIALDRVTSSGFELFAANVTIAHAIVFSGVFAGMRQAGKPLNDASTGIFFPATSSQDTAETRVTALLLQLFASPVAQAGILSTATVDRSHVPTLVRDATTGRFYWPRLLVDKAANGAPMVSEFLLGDSRSRPSAVLGANLYRAGAYVAGYDGRLTWESGFLGPVRIESLTPIAGGGSVPAATVITVAVCFEWTDSNGDLHQSSVSDPVTVTTGALGRLVVVVPVPPTARFPGVTLVAFRTVNGTKQLRRAGSVSTISGQYASINMTDADATLANNAVIYTQGARGALSGVLPHEAPEPCDFICRHGERLLTGGLPNRRRAQLSKRQFVNEPIQWSGSSSHYVEAPDEIVGVASMDLRGYLFCRQSIHVFGGDGPNDANEGGFSQVVKLPSSTGLKDDRSILEIPEGLLFQGDDSRVYLIPRGGGAPVSFADAVEDTLALFPTITAAVLLREEQVAVLCCTNGVTSKLCVYDLQTKTWMVDEYSSNFPITAACEYQGQLALISAGRVHLERGTHPDSAFITHSLRTGTVKPFDGWGKIQSITLLGEHRGACTLTARISYDDAKTFTALKAHSLTGTAGDVVRRQWWPKRRKGDRYVIEFEVTATGGVATEGLAMNECLLEVTKAGGSPRLAAAQRG